MTGTGWRQTITVALIDFRRVLGQRRIVALLLLGLIPVALAMIRAIFLPEAQRLDIGRATTELAQVFYVFQLRFVIFFACAFVFVRSLRGEILDRSLHFALLAPIRREWLAVGKYLGALALTLIVLIPSTLALIVMLHIPHGIGRALTFLTSARGLEHVSAYVFVTGLACVGYGAIFFLAGLYFKSPMIPAAAYLGFEIAAPFLGSTIGSLSIARHLRALLPVPLSLGPLDVVTSSPGWLATVILLAVSGVALLLAALKARTIEIAYSGSE